MRFDDFAVLIFEKFRYFWDLQRWNGIIRSMHEKMQYFFKEIWYFGDDFEVTLEMFVFEFFLFFELMLLCRS